MYGTLQYESRQSAYTEHTDVLRREMRAFVDGYVRGYLDGVEHGIEIGRYLARRGL